jgi:hypothetical protein
MNDSPYTIEQADKIHDEMRGAITTEIQTMQSVMKIQMDGLATKKDVQEVIKFVKNVDTGVSFFRISGRLLAQVGSFIAAIVAIYLAIKFFLGAVIIHLFK